MFRTLLRSILGFALSMAFTLPLFSQQSCDCVGLGLCPAQVNDNGVTTLEMPVNMPGAPTLDQCPLESVCITITHTWVGDLSISLVSPKGEHYLIVADAGNYFGECGTAQDNMEICVTTGTNHPLTNNAEYVCNSAPCSIGTCCLNGNWTVPCGGVINPITGAVQAPHCDLNDFNLAGAPVNGIWKLIISDVCNMDVGSINNFSLNFACGNSPGNSNCSANGGILGVNDMVYCGPNPIDVTPVFCAGDLPDSNYSYAYVISLNDEIKAFAPTIDMVGYAAGIYEIWGFSYENGASGQLVNFVGGSLQTTRSLFDNGTSPFCGDFSGDNFMVNVVGAPSVGAGPNLVLDCWETGHDISAPTFPTGSNFAYTWASSNGQVLANGTTFYASQSGDYVFAVADSLTGCTFTDTMHLTIPPPLIDSIVTSPASCNQADGAASVVLQTGVGNADFAWSIGGNSQTNAGLAQGWYSVTVSDSNCSYHQNFYMDEALSCKVVIRGKVLNDDLDRDCVTDNSTLGIQCIMLHLLPADIYTYSAADGSYEFVVDAGDYSIEYVDEDEYELLCPSSGSISLSLTTDGSISEGNNFYTKKENHPNLSINTFLGAARPGFYQTNQIKYCNLGGEPANAVITLVYDSLQQNLTSQSVPGNIDVNAHTTTWTIQNILPSACNYIYYSTYLPSDVPLGTLLSGSISIYPIINDEYPSNNVQQWNQAVTGSFDPNEKTTLTGENQWGGLILASDSILHYQVAFQNTGTDTAFAVVVRDTLDANLDVETIRPGMSSHPYQLQFEGNNVLVFNFQDIMLPDSNRNELASHGYLTFSIKRKPDLAIGTQIHNSAAIFFDYNAPIITNAVTHTLGKYSVHSQDAFTLCFGEQLNGTVYEANTSFITTYSFTTYDSIVTTNVTVLPQISSDQTTAICQGSTFIFNNQTLTASGLYTSVVPAANGCDSTIHLTLNVLPSIEYNISASICEGETYLFGGTELSATGIYQNTFTAVGGCDSTETLSLTVLPLSQTNFSAEICTGETYFFNGQNLTVAGVYSMVLPAANGCDSTVTLNLNILPAAQSNLAAEICTGETYFFNGQNLTVAGVYSMVLPAANGCDSTVTLNLNILPAVQSYLSAEICAGETYFFNGQNLTVAGVYSMVLPAANGCDSTVTLNLNLLQIAATYFEAEICDGEQYIFAGNPLTTSGDFLATMSAVNGCDSLVHLHLTVKPNVFFTQQLEILLGNSWNGTPVYSDTTIMEVFTASNGCDSTVMTQFSVLTNTRNLVKTSYDLLVFPNPFDVSASIQLKGVEQGKLLNFKLLDLTGRVVQQQEFRSPAITFQREGLPAGLYFIKIEEAGKLVGLGRVVAK